MKKPILIIGGITVLAILLGSAAFVGGRLLTGQGMTSTSSGNGSGPSLMGPNGPVSVDFQPAEELPQTPADVSGLFDHRQENSVFVSAGGQATVMRDASGNVSGDSDGQIVEIVVTSQTDIYSDVTKRQYDGQPEEGQKIQQVLEPGSLDDVGEAYHILVWGRETGGRFIAEVLVYSPPF